MYVWQSFSEVSAFSQELSPHLLILICLQFKIFLMPKWHILILNMSKRKRHVQRQLIKYLAGNFPGGPVAKTAFTVQWASEAAQSCLILCNPMDCCLPGSSLHGIFQARVLEWVAISFSRGSSWPRDQTQVSCITGRCFTVWATREALKIFLMSKWHILNIRREKDVSRGNL